MSVVVERAGLLTTVQDLGRRAQRHGVVRGGVMDRRAARVANLLVGNDEGAALLEATLLGPTLAFRDDHLVALAGADLDARVDDVAVQIDRPFAVRAGATLAFGGARRGCRVCIAIGGGIDVPAVLGSRATDIAAHIGGVDGRALAPGNVLELLPRGTAAGHRMRALLDAADAGAPCAVARWGAARSLGSAHTADRARIRIVAGPELPLFRDGALDALTGTDYIVTPQSNRMGYRLEGAKLELRSALDMLSSPVTTGTVQVPPNGDPIVLMADGQTVGGYPRMAHVISVDLPLLAQLAPGAHVRFSPVTLDEAQRLYVQQERDMRMFAAGVSLR